MIRFLCLILGISFFLSSCTKTVSDYRASGSSIAVIRGFEARNETGQTLGDIGNPDIHLYYPSGNPTTSQLYISSYPNPAKDIMVIYLSLRNNDRTVRLWIVPATFTGSGSDAVSFLGPTIIAPAEKPLLDTVMEVSSGSRFIPIRNLPEGYYRIYLKANGILLWDNIVFSKIAQHF